MWKLIFNVADVIFKFGSPKRKPHKIHKLMPHLKLSKNMLLGQKNWRTNKNCNSYGLVKYNQISTIQKSLAIKQLGFSRNNSSYEFIILYYIIYWILIINLECESILKFLFCDVLIRQPIHIFWLQKSITTNKWFFYQ
jgi:hypothetical protein